MHPLRHCIIIASLIFAATTSAQQFHTLSDGELAIDSLPPLFTTVIPLARAYADSTYEVAIEYPEYKKMTRREARRYRHITGGKLPEWPVVDTYVGVSRHKGNLYTSFSPIVRRDGKNLKLTSFKLAVTARARERREAPAAATYASHSLLAEGRWVKIRIGATGFHHLSDSLLRAAGFTAPGSVCIYGYGGSMQPEKLTADYIAATDDLKQLPTAVIGGRRLFYAEGPVRWEKASSTKRTRNPYSDYGYYFLTDGSGEEPLILDSAAFVSSHYPTPADYHALYEVDDYAWYHGGRNLYDQRVFAIATPRTYRLPTYGVKQGQIGIAMTYAGFCHATVAIGDSVVGTIAVDSAAIKGAGRKQYLDSYSYSAADNWYYDYSSLPDDSVDITITQLDGAVMRLDNIELRLKQPRPLPHLATVPLPEPEVVGEVANQDRHGDGPADMVIIIPTSRALQEQAERLAALHATYDSLRVRVVTAGELYNEFSSGTPDVNAYRRYMKMLYDRADSEADMPRFLVLFGDGVYDNRLHSGDFRLLNADDLLLCYESENSMSMTACYVSDDYYCMLDDGEGGDLLRTDKSDIAVGRLPARTLEEAATLVDKAYSYRLNEYAGGWQNTICLMGDDGNANMHMNDAEAIATLIDTQWPDYLVRKVYWDAYQRVSSAQGYAFPDVTSLVQQQMREGALLMNYSGHGASNTLSHEYSVTLADFKAPTSLRLPLWFTASCDVSPFDGSLENIGEQAVFNKQGGAIAFIGTTRTVYAIHNRSLNLAFVRHLFTTGADGRRTTIGEALSRAKNDQVKGAGTSQAAGINKLHFALLGDPALELQSPTTTAVIDSINGQAVADGTLHIVAGDTARVSGHIVGHDDFRGLVTLTIRDAEVSVTCRLNPQPTNEMPSQPLVYNDRPTTLFVGSDSVSNGRFTVRFAMPKDVSYSDTPGQILVYAVNDSRSIIAHGHNETFTIVSAETYSDDGDGPLIHAWLDQPAFAEGTAVSNTPHFHADLYDDDGINISGSGIGHDQELTVDGLMRYTYNLNSYFQYDFGDYRAGSIDFTLPHLDEGSHTLTFRAWDVLNNSSSVSLTFTVGSTGSLSGIDDTTQASLLAPHVYDLQGRRATLADSRSALLIIRKGDGTVKKIRPHKTH